MKIVIALLVAFALSTTAFAKELSFTSCTADSHAVVLVVDVNDELAGQHPVVEHIKAAFDSAAQSMTAADLLGEQGFVTFASGLDETDFNAIDSLTAPVVTGSCSKS